MAGTPQWQRTSGFLLATVGFAIGLGNLWRFPFLAGENGGGAFVLVYLAGLLLIGVPLLMAELAIGRRGRASPPQAISSQAQAQGQGSPASGFRWIGYLQLLTAALIMVGYAVVAGWALHYFFDSLLQGFAPDDPALVLERFAHGLEDARDLAAWTLLALLLVAVVLFAGVNRGVERAGWVLVPTLVLLVSGLAIYNATAGGMEETLGYLFRPDFGRINDAVILLALEQAFFSLGVAMAGMMTFGAYLDKSVSIVRSALSVALVVSLVALLTGLVAFPLVFRFGAHPGAGVAVVMETMTLAFARIPGGQWVGSAFFLLLVTATLTSMLGLTEPLVAWVQDQFKLPRAASVLLVLVILWLGTSVSVLSYSEWRAVAIHQASLTQVIDIVPRQLLLPLGALLLALFAGWRWRAEPARRELALGPIGFFLWRSLIRYLVPVAVAWILLAEVFRVRLLF